MELVRDLGVVVETPSSEVIDGVGVLRCTLKVNLNL